MQTALPYKPQQFLEDVRTWLVDHGHISEAERRAIRAQPICYLAQDPSIEETQRHMMGYHDENYGLTTVDRDKGNTPIKTYIFGCDHHKVQMRMALTLIHEMAHVIITDEADDHGPRWAAEARHLGIEANPLIRGDGEYPEPNKGELPEHWTDPHLYAYASALPQVDWSHLDEDAALLEAETETVMLSRMAHDLRLDEG